MSYFWNRNRLKKNTQGLWLFTLMAAIAFVGLSVQSAMAIVYMNQATYYNADPAVQKYAVVSESVPDDMRVSVVASAGKASGPTALNVLVVDMGAANTQAITGYDYIVIMESDSVQNLIQFDGVAITANTVTNEWAGLNNSVLLYGVNIPALQPATASYKIHIKGNRTSGVPFAILLPSSALGASFPVYTGPTLLSATTPSTVTAPSPVVNLCYDQRVFDSDQVIVAAENGSTASDLTNLSSLDSSGGALLGEALKEASITIGTNIAISTEQIVGAKTYIKVTMTDNVAVGDTITVATGANVRDAAGNSQAADQASVLTAPSGSLGNLTISKSAQLAKYSLGALERLSIYLSAAQIGAGLCGSTIGVACIPLFAATLGVSLIEGWQIALILNDPPDSNYQEIFQPKTYAPLVVTDNSSEFPADILPIANQFFSDHAMLYSMLEAWRTTLERYNAAMNAGDVGAAANQESALNIYVAEASLWAESCATSNRSLVDKLESVIGPIVIPESVVLDALSKLREEGFDESILELLASYGLEEMDIEGLKNTLLSSIPPSTDVNLWSIMSNEADSYFNLATITAGGAIPIANAGPDQSLMANTSGSATATLDGSNSSDADSSKGTNDGIVKFEWFENDGLLATGEVVNVSLGVGGHEIKLVVTDGKGATGEDKVYVTVSIPGDINHDGVVDKKDLNIINANLNKPASVCPACDIDKDGKITVLDARKLVLMCTCPKCVCP